MILFLGILFLGDTSLLLLLIPMLNFGLFVFFEIQSIFKQNPITNNNVLNFSPVGNPQIISSRIFKITLLQLVIIIIMDIESIIHPQLIDNYFIIYPLIMGILQIFLLFFLFNDIAFYSKVEMQIRKTPIPGLDDSISNETLVVQKKIISYLKIDAYKKIFFEIKVFCVVLELIWCILIILGLYIDIVPLSFSIPGSYLAAGTQIRISLLAVIILYLTLFLMIFYFRKVYCNITTINPTELNLILEQLPKIEQEKLKKTLNYIFNS